MFHRRAHNLSFALDINLESFRERKPYVPISSKRTTDSPMTDLSASSRCFAAMNNPSATRTTAYWSSGLTAIPILAVNVHGVVVQTINLTGSSPFRRLCRFATRAEFAYWSWSMLCKSKMTKTESEIWSSL